MTPTAGAVRRRAAGSGGGAGAGDRSGVPRPLGPLCAEKLSDKFSSLQASERAQSAASVLCRAQRASYGAPASAQGVETVAAVRRRGVVRRPGALAPAVGGAAVPGHGRAWELVTPGETNGVPIGGARAWSADGDRVLFWTRGALPGASGSELARAWEGGAHARRLGCDACGQPLHLGRLGLLVPDVARGDPRPLDLLWASPSRCFLVRRRIRWSAFTAAAPTGRSSCWAAPVLATASALASRAPPRTSSTGLPHHGPPAARRRRALLGQRRSTSSRVDPSARKRRRHRCGVPVRSDGRRRLRRCRAVALRLCRWPADLLHGSARLRRPAARLRAPGRCPDDRSGDLALHPAGLQRAAGRHVRRRDRRRRGRCCSPPAGS